MQGGLNAKAVFNYNVSYFNLGGFGALFCGAKPTKAPRGDGTEFVAHVSCMGVEGFFPAGDQKY